MADELMIGTTNAVALVSGTSLEKLLKPLKQEILLYDTYVAGTGYINDKTILDELKNGDVLWLQREPENKFDEKAILVLDGKKRKIGYVPESDNTVFSRLMDAGKYLTAKIVKMETKGSFRQINISIFLVDF
ncbi:MAG: HIRAN domain-containing protein [Lachnospiraceae bacterium]|nr:HIRAN domain-containing protein [Lachnospiraceae bacterium]